MTTPTITFPRAQPGGLIKAAQWNSLLATVESLEERVSILETAGPGSVPGGPPFLTARNPTGDVEVGTLLTLLGQNFTPLSLTTVALGPATIDHGAFAAGSNDTALSFQVPDAFSAGTLPATFPITVSTPQGTSQALSVVVQPAPSTGGQGDVVVSDATLPQGTLNGGAIVTFEWDVRSDTLSAETYALSAVYDDVSPLSSKPDWESATTLNVTQVTLGTGQTQHVVASVHVPASANTATLILKVLSLDGAIGRTSNALALKVGQATAVSDARTTVVLGDVGPGNDAGNGPNPVSLSTDPTGAPVINVKHGSSGSVPASVTVVDPTNPPMATYVFSASIDTPGAMWSTGPIHPASAGRTAAMGAFPVTFGITNNAPAGQDPGDTYMVLKATRRNAAGTADAYTSFTRFRIHGTQ
jgi:hypothetical protein